ncbi:uncharacterized protein LOC110851721 isoform X2 [Folsomia candida]|uniref:uncharacterized protein LOC110851721 isoform X2 n=1 Tax=Folsomia candida TaxID=158441 RepID=UPI000B906E6A|nr:uncharacterized protein LOC110851721 isoform X2 [Folsomia candida]
MAENPNNKEDPPASSEPISNTSTNIAETLDPELASEEQTIPPNADTPSLSTGGALSAQPSAEPPQSESAASQPESAASQPESAAPQPESAAPQPESAASQPESAASQPESAAPQPESGPPQPSAAIEAPPTGPSATQPEVVVPAGDPEKSKVVISEKITAFSAPPSSAPSVVVVDVSSSSTPMSQDGSMHYEDQKWGLDKEPPFVVREWKAQSWASSAASSGTAMETFTKSLKFATDGSMAHEDQAWKLDREPDQVSKDGGAAPPTEALITEPAKLPDPQQSTLFSADGSLAYEEQPWNLERDPTKSGQNVPSNNIGNLATDGSMAYENQPWVLEKDTSKGQNKVPPSVNISDFASDGLMAYENQPWMLEKDTSGGASKGLGSVNIKDFTSDGSMAYENQPWILEKDTSGGASKGPGSANISDFTSDGSMAYENQPWVLEKDTSGRGAMSSLASDGSMAYENQPWKLERDPSRFSTNGPSIAYFEYSLKDGSRNPVQTQTDADGNPFENVCKGPDMKTGDCGKCRVADECFPNQTECNDLEFGQLVGFAQDFVYETKQLGWYFISQCLEWLNDDKCDPCVCRDGNQNEVSTTKSAINLNKVAVSESASKDLIGNGPSINPSDGSMAYENQPWVLERDPAQGSVKAPTSSRFGLIEPPASDGSLAYENQPWVLEKDPVQSGGVNASSSKVVGAPSATSTVKTLQPSQSSVGLNTADVESKESKTVLQEKTPSKADGIAAAAASDVALVPSDVSFEAQSWTLEKDSSQTTVGNILSLELATEISDPPKEIKAEDGSAEASSPPPPDSPPTPTDEPSTTK